MSDNIIQILDTKLKTFFDKEGQIADVLNLLGKKEKNYLYKRLNVITLDTEWYDLEQKLKLKIDAINSLILLVVEKPQLNELLRNVNGQSSKTFLVQLYELLFDLNVAYLGNLKTASFEKLDCLMLTAITGICSDKTPEVAMLIENNKHWVNDIFTDDLSLKLRVATFKYNLSLFGIITKSSHIDEIKIEEQNAVNLLIEHQQAESNKETMDIETGLIIGIFGNLIHVLKNIKEYLFTGTTLVGDNITSIIETYIFNALKLSKSLDSDSLINIIHHNRYSLEQLCNNSIWQIADRSPLIKTFFQSSIVKGDHLILTLLPSQRKTILEILTAKKSVVVNMPTSSGKSLLAELYILFTIQSQTYKGFEPTIAYIVPTNALINQVKYKLRRLFGDTYRIESALPFYEEDSLEEEILNSSNQHIHILITTPEKLDFLVRNERPVIKNLKLIILDEAHNLSDKGRGSKFELLLSVIKQKRTDVNFLLLSPFIKNAKEISRWLGDSEENSMEVSVTWAPTKQYVGCCTYNTLKTESYITYFPTTRNMIVEDPIEIPLGIYITALKSDLGKSKVDDTVKIIALLEKYLNIGESTLVFCQGAGSAQRIAKQAKEYFHNKGLLKDLSDNPEIQRALTLIKLDSKEDDPLIDLIRYGISYHHSQLSALIKEEIEKLITNGNIKIIFATPTLAQGMNFPITTVIFSTTRLGGGANSEEMSSAIFWNIAGRAGRAFMDTEGHVIIGYANSNEATIAKTKKYIVNDIKEIISSLNSFFKSIDGVIVFDYQLVKNNPGVSNFLQYLNHIIKVAYNYNLDSLDTGRIRSILNNSLFYRQITFEQGFVETQKKVNDFALGYIKHLKGENKQLLSLADVFGISDISLNSVSGLIHGYKEEVKASFAANDVENHLHASKIILNTKNIDDLARVVTILSRIPELKVAMRDTSGTFDPVSVAKVIIGWVNGENVNSIAQKTIKPGETVEDAIGICNKFINGNLRNYLPWGLNIYQTLTQDSANETAKMLPSFVYYGVNSKESVILASLGIPRFIIPNVTKTLADTFQETISVENMESIRKKLKTIDDFGIGANELEKRNIKEIIASYV